VLNSIACCEIILGLTGLSYSTSCPVILDIFAQHAKTREGKLQVDLALHEYRKPRLTKMWTHLERQSGAGGVGLRGPGESQLEIDKRLIRDRIITLKQKISAVQKQRAMHRQGRSRTGLPVLSLVGYTMQVSLFCIHVASCVQDESPAPDLKGSQLHFHSREKYAAEFPHQSWSSGRVYAVRNPRPYNPQSAASGLQNSPVCAGNRYCWFCSETPNSPGGSVPCHTGRSAGSRCVDSRH